MWRDRHGGHHFGEKPMFEDIEENIGAAIKAKFLEVFGCYPILDVSESLEIRDNDDDGWGHVLHSRSYSAIFDIEHLDKIDDFAIGYVDTLLERVLKERLRNPESKDVDTSASQKYSFSDTEDWWAPMVLAEFPEGRERFALIVELG
jgi:hypothetical protein